MSRTMALKRISVTDYRGLKEYFFGLSIRHSVYSVSSIVAWSDCVFQGGYVILGNNTLIIAYESDIYPDDRHMLLPISPKRDIPPEGLRELSSSMGYINIWFVPQDYMEKHGYDRVESHFEISEQPEFEDYVYLTQDLALLKGNRYMRKRNLINQFNRSYVAKGRVTVGFVGPDDIAECLDFFNEWCELRDCEIEKDESLACEQRALIKSLRNLERLEMKGILIRIDGRVRAFAISSHLSEEMGVLNFEKASSDIRGLYQYLDMECAKRLFTNYMYINKESDMNMPNLAKAKASYHPVLRVKSYRLRLR